MCLRRLHGRRPRFPATLFRGQNRSAVLIQVSGKGRRQVQIRVVRRMGKGRAQRVCSAASFCSHGFRTVPKRHRVSVDGKALTSRKCVRGAGVLLLQEARLACSHPRLFTLSDLEDAPVRLLILDSRNFCSAAQRKTHHGGDERNGRSNEEG